MPWPAHPGVRATPVPLPPNFDEETAREDLYDTGERKVFDKFVDIMMGEVVQNAECRKMIAIITPRSPEQFEKFNSVNGSTIRKRADGAAVIHYWELTAEFCMKQEEAQRSFMDKIAEQQRSNAAEYNRLEQERGISR